MNLESDHVFLAQCDAPAYKRLSGTAPLELPDGTVYTTALGLLRTLFEDAALDSGHFGTEEWNPLPRLLT